MIGAGAGSVRRSFGAFVVARLPGARIGAGACIAGASGEVRGSVVSLDGALATIAVRSDLRGVAVGDRVRAEASPERRVFGYALLGRAIDANGNALDGGPAPAGFACVPCLDAPAPSARAPIRNPLATGVRAIDGLLTVGEGARVGIFGPAGTGKSTLLETIASGARADAAVIALVGERGREARAWIDRLTPRTTIVCATGDRPAGERVRAAHDAFAQAALLRRRGLQVLLVLDSLARYAYALREERLALGEAPGRGGFPPGVFTDLARLVECAGTGPRGSVTLLATVLSEHADDDPLAEAARSLLDGHLVLSADRAAAGAFPAIDVLASSSRTMRSVTLPAQQRDAAAIRAALARIAETKDARELGFVHGGDDALARALRAEPAIEAFLRQEHPADLASTTAGLRELALLLA